MAVVLKNDYDRLAAELEDTQESLCAALARIEAFRQRERVLLTEIAALRSPVAAASDTDGAAAPPGAAVPVAAAPRAAPPADAPPPAAAAAEAAPKAADAPDAQDRPTYIVDIGDQVPVMILNGSRKMPAGVVITPDFIDFVQITARIKREQFVGFTSAAKRQQSLIPCLSPSAADAPDEEPEPFGGPHPGPGGPADPHADASAAAAAAAARASRRTSWASSLIGGALSWPASPKGPPPAPSAGLAGFGSASFGGGGGGGGGAGWPESPLTRSGSGSSGGLGPGGGGGKTGAWQVLWRSEQQQHSLCFEATQEARQVLHRHTAKWLGQPAEDDAGHARQRRQQQQQQQQQQQDQHHQQWQQQQQQQPDNLIGPAAGGGGIDGGPVEIVPPRMLDGAGTSSFVPRTSEPSALLGPRQLAALAAALPTRYRASDWTLAYSTARHGISLRTLYRKAAGAAPSVLVARDAGGHVFGAFCAEVWRVAPRFYGTGETFVFQLQPHAVMYPWRVQAPVKNDYFMYSTQECLAVGGQGRFAIWLDADLLRGSSGACGTFGSPCLAAREEFKLHSVELWHVGGG